MMLLLMMLIIFYQYFLFLRFDGHIEKKEKGLNLHFLAFNSQEQRLCMVV